MLKNYFKFKNFRNLFTFKGFTILVATLVLSFWVRCLVILFYNLDLSPGEELVFLGVLLSFLGFICDSLYDIFSIFHPVSLLYEDTDKGKNKAKADNTQIYLLPIAFNFNATTNNSIRRDYRISSSNKIEYKRFLEHVSGGETPQFLSSVSFTRPTSDYNKGDDVIRFIHSLSRSNVINQRSPLISPIVLTA